MKMKWEISILPKIFKKKDIFIYFLLFYIFMDNKVPIYIRIDEDIKNLSTNYIYQSKLQNITKTNTRNKLVEEALKDFIARNPIYLMLRK